MFNRRTKMHGLASGVGAALSSSLVPQRILASPAVHTTPPKRVVFFLQNQGFDARTFIPEAMKSSGSLAKVKLPEPISALEPYKERLHIINGLHGTHTSPSHNGANWPIMQLGNFDGAFKTGRFTQLDGDRPINSLYASLLRAVGQNCDRFNMDEILAKKVDSGNGPLNEVLT